MYPGPEDPDLGVFVAQLERALRERGHEVELAVLDRRGGKRRFATLLERTLVAAGRFRPDVVYAHFLVPAGTIASLVPRVPLVVTAHGRDVRNVGTLPGIGTLTRRTVARAAAVIAVSDYLRRELEAKVPEARGKTEVIDSGVDLDRFRVEPAPNGEASFLCLGALTDELEERARELIERVDELGGAVAAVEQGFVQGEIEEAAFRYSQQVESGERVIVGVNRYEEAEAEQIELHRLDPDAERRQLERTARVRSERDATAAEAAVARVREAARGSANLLPPLRNALAAHCTVGELCETLREEFGMYDAQRTP